MNDFVISHVFDPSVSSRDAISALRLISGSDGLALQLFLRASSESMGNHDSDIVDADGVG